MVGNRDMVDMVRRREVHRKAVTVLLHPVMDCLLKEEVTEVLRPAGTRLNNNTRTQRPVYVILGSPSDGEIGLKDTVDTRLKDPRHLNLAMVDMVR